jgi:hypothetical protein
VAWDEWFAQHFRNVNDWAVDHGHCCGIPTCIQSGGGWKVMTIDPEYENYVDIRDVSQRALRLSSLEDMRLRLTAAHDYARRTKYIAEFQEKTFFHGYPNFHQPDYGAGIVFGTFLIKPGLVDHRDVVVRNLPMSGEPTTNPMSVWFKRVNEYAEREPGYAAGMPNGHYIRNSVSREWVIGTLLFPDHTVSSHVVSL